MEEEWRFQDLESDFSVPFVRNRYSQNGGSDMLKNRAGGTAIVYEPNPALRAGNNEPNRTESNRCRTEL